MLTKEQKIKIVKAFVSGKIRKDEMILLLEKGVIAPMIAWTNTPPEEMKRRELIEIILEKKISIDKENTYTFGESYHLHCNYEL